MAHESRSRTPQSGELLILADSRRFVIADAETGIRGWWFTATSQDGRSTLQGNLRLEWDSQAAAWRPAGVRRGPAQHRVMRLTPQPRYKQLD
jgi:hypothetical protein